VPCVTAAHRRRPPPSTRSVRTRKGAPTNLDAGHRGRWQGDPLSLPTPVAPGDACFSHLGTFHRAQGTGHEARGTRQTDLSHSLLRSPGARSPAAARATLQPLHAARCSLLVSHGSGRRLELRAGLFRAGQRRRLLKCRRGEGAISARRKIPAQVIGERRTRHQSETHDSRARARAHTHTCPKRAINLRPKVHTRAHAHTHTHAPHAPSI